jgi:hypothetical protein
MANVNNNNAQADAVVQPIQGYSWNLLRGLTAPKDAATSKVEFYARKIFTVLFIPLVILADAAATGIMNLYNKYQIRQLNKAQANEAIFEIEEVAKKAGILGPVALNSAQEQLKKLTSEVVKAAKKMVTAYGDTKKYSETERGNAKEAYETCVEKFDGIYVAITGQFNYENRDAIQQDFDLVSSIEAQVLKECGDKATIDLSIAGQVVIKYPLAQLILNGVNATQIRNYAPDKIEKSSPVYFKTIGLLSKWNEDDFREFIRDGIVSNYVKDVMSGKVDEKSNLDMRLSDRIRLSLKSGLLDLSIVPEKDQGRIQKEQKIDLDAPGAVEKVLIQYIKELAKVELEPMISDQIRNCFFADLNFFGVTQALENLLQRIKDAIEAGLLTTDGEKELREQLIFNDPNSQSWTDLLRALAGKFSTSGNDENVLSLEVSKLEQAGLISNSTDAQIIFDQAFELAGSKEVELEELNQQALDQQAAAKSVQLSKEAKNKHDAVVIDLNDLLYKRMLLRNQVVATMNLRNAELLKQKKLAGELAGSIGELLHGRTIEEVLLDEQDVIAPVNEELAAKSEAFKTARKAYQELAQRIRKCEEDVTKKNGEITELTKAITARIEQAKQNGVDVKPIEKAMRKNEYLVKFEKDASVIKKIEGNEKGIKKAISDALRKELVKEEPGMLSKLAERFKKAPVVKKYEGRGNEPVSQPGMLSRLWDAGNAFLARELNAQA